MQPRTTWLDASAGVDESCYIETPLGVASVLQAIAAARTRTALHPDGGGPALSTTLLGVADDPPALYFACPAAAGAAQRLLAAERVVFVTADQGVPVQFSAQSPAPARYCGAPALSVTPPGRILRMQRRSHYRLPGEPTHARLGCEIVIAEDTGAPGSVMKPEVLDVSCGGLGAAVAASEPALAPGTRSTCSLELPGVGRVDSTVEVKAASDIVLPNGRAGRRYGMAFVNLAGRTVTAIQRYILEQQRARTRLRPACS